LKEKTIAKITENFFFWESGFTRLKRGSATFLKQPSLYYIHSANVMMMMMMTMMMMMMMMTTTTTTTTTMTTKVTMWLLTKRRR